MATQIVCTYTLVDSGNLPPASLAARMAAAPIDLDFLYFWGLRLAGDSTGIVTNTVQRIITLAMGPVSDAVVTSHLFSGDTSGSPVASITVGTQGAGYVRPPVVLPGGKSDEAAKLGVSLGVVGVSVTGGSGYPSSAQIVAVGGNLAFGGTQATFATGNAGGVLSVSSILTPGGPYNSVPSLVVVGGGTGVGFEGTADLGVIEVPVIRGGVGYTSAPPITLTPYFKSLIPDAAGLVEQAAAVQNFMTQILQSATRSPVLSTAVAS